MKFFPQRSTIRLSMLANYPSIMFDLWQENGKALAQGLQIPLISHSESYLKMCPIPLLTGLTRLTGERFLHRCME